MILSHNAAVFIHTFNHKLGSIGRDSQELRAEKVHRVSQVIDGMANCDHCIATGFMISLAKLEHLREGRLDVVGTVESDFISAFVY
jgi:hypothetical protein